MNRKIFLYGDNIDTDRIIPGKYTKTLHVQDLVDHAFEDLDPTFKSRVEAGDIVVAGLNFGCGSSREQAPIAIKASGISLVVARSFARIFFRNAINVGLPLMEIPNHTIESTSQLDFDLSQGVLRDHRQDREYRVEPLPTFLNEIIQAGGLVPYLRNATTPMGRG